MKKNLFVILLSVVSISFSSCYKDCDFNPIKLHVDVVDDSGQNLLISSVDGNILDDNISFIYEDEKLPLVRKTDATRAYLPRFYGLVLDEYKYGEVGEHHLYFGEFDGTGRHDVSFSIEWEDGTVDLIRFECNTTLKNNGSFKDRTSTVYLNGVKQSSDLLSVKIVK